MYIFYLTLHETLNTTCNLIGLDLDVVQTKKRLQAVKIILDVVMEPNLDAVLMVLRSPLDLTIKVQEID